MTARRLTTRNFTVRITTAIPVLTSILLLATSAFGETELVNKTGAPLVVMNVADMTGQQLFARVYMTGEKMRMSAAGDWPVSGAGYVEGVEGHRWYIPVHWKDSVGTAWRGGLYAKKVEWDDSGRTTSIDSLSSEFETACGKFKIMSDVENLKIVDGVLHLRFDGPFADGHRFTMRFGQEGTVAPTDLCPRSG